MDAHHAIFFTAPFLTALFCSSGTLHAQMCSGGGGGGMDVTGNDCNVSTTTLMSVSPPDGEDSRMGMQPVLKATAGRGDQISGAPVPVETTEAARLEALLSEQVPPADSASQAPAD